MWHFQLVHHDLWDRDPPQAPVLVTVTRDGKPVEAVAQATKSGHVFVFDRVSGAPLFPVEERPFPPSDLEGEQTSPTQPLPLKPPPFARQQLTEADLTDLSPESHAAVLARFRRVRSGGQFVPPSTQGTVIFPGFDGGAEWGGSAFDPDTHLLYVNANEMPWILEMLPLPKPGRGGSLGTRVYAEHCTVCHGVDGRGDPQHQFPSLVGVKDRLARKDVLELLAKGKGVMPSFAFLSKPEQEAVAAHVRGEPEDDHGTGEAARSGRPYTHLGYNRFLDPEGYPAVKPPWGTLNAIDLDAGEIRWSVPLGELPALTQRGRARHGHRELRRTDRDRGRSRLHRGHEGRALPRVRQADRARAVGDDAAGWRLRDAGDVRGERQAVRRHRRRRRQDGHEVGRCVRGVRPALIEHFAHRYELRSSINQSCERTGRQPRHRAALNRDQ